MKTPEIQFDRRAIPQDAAETRWSAPDGQAIRRIDWLIPRGTCRGSMLFLPGRGDAYEKYLETLDYWHRKGWRVTASDWRGQAGSGRLGNDDVTGHIGDFAVWVADLAVLWREWKRSTPAPHILIGHSMGGHLVLRALAEGVVDPDAVVLSTPMLGFRDKYLPSFIMHMAAKAMKALGDPRRPAWKWSEKPRALPANRDQLLTHDAARYGDEVWWRDARPEIAMGPGSWGWVERAYASTRKLDRRSALDHIATPVLLIAAEGDGLVDCGAIRRAAGWLPNAELALYGQGARHELLREEDRFRDAVLDAIDGFLDRKAPLAD